MARVVKKINGNGLAVANVVTIDLPVHTTGDVIQIFVGVNTGTLTTPASLSQDGYVNGGEDLYSFTHVGEAIPLTSIAITSSNATTEFTYHIYVCKGVPTTAYVSAYQPLYDSANTGTPTATALLPLDDNCLVFACAVGGGNITTLPPVGWFDGGCSNSSSSGISSSSAYINQATAATTGAIKFPLGSDIKDRFSYIVIALKSSDASIEAMCSGVPANIIHAMGNDCGHDGIGEVNLSATITTVGATFTTRNEAGTEVIGGLIDGYRNASTRTGSSSFTDQAILQVTPLASAKDFTNMKLSIAPVYLGKRTPRTYADYASFFGLYDSVAGAWRIWRIKSNDSIPSIKTRTMTVLDVSGGYEDETVGAFSLTAITHIFFGRVIEKNAGSQEMCWYPIYDLQTIKVIGGNATRPVNFQTAVDLAKTAGLNTVQNQSGQSLGQFYATQSISTGDGSSPTVWDSTGQSIEFPSALDIANGRVQSKIAQASLAYSIDSDAVVPSNTFNMGDYHQFNYVSGAVTGAGLVLNGTVNLSNVTGAMKDWTFADCISFSNVCDMSAGNSYKNIINPITIDSEAALSLLGNGNFDNSTLIIVGDQSGIWADKILKFSNNVKDIEYTGTTPFRLMSSTPITVNNSNTGILTIDTPQPTLTITGFISGSIVLIHDLDSADPQDKGTELLRNNNAISDIAYIGTASNIVSISAYKSGYKRFYAEYTIAPTDATFTINQELETN